MCTLGSNESHSNMTDKQNCKPTFFAHFPEISKTSGIYTQQMIFNNIPMNMELDFSLNLTSLECETFVNLPDFVENIGLVSHSNDGGHRRGVLE